MISINSLGILLMACINAPPTFINPNKAADKNTPIGVLAGLAGATFYVGYTNHIKVGVLPTQGYDGIIETRKSHIISHLHLFS